MRNLAARLILLALVAAVPLASAHDIGGFGPAPPAKPLPGFVVWFAGASVVALSFVLVGAFLTRTGPPAPEAPVGARRGLRVPRLAAAVLSLAGLTALALVVAGAFTATPLRFPEVAVWFALFALAPLVAYVFGDVWSLVSPFALVADLVERARRGRAPPVRYPARLGAWPAVALLLVLVGLEGATNFGHDPRGLPLLALAYALATFMGIALFGGEAWLANAEVFTRMFRTWSAVSFVDVTRERIALRRAGAGLRDVARDVSGVAFVLALLEGASFDAFLDTGAGRSLYAALAPSLGALATRFLILAVGFVLFAALFAWTVRAIARASESLAPREALAARFVASLLPIAVAYHLAHNGVYLAVNGGAAFHDLANPLGAWHPALLDARATLPAWTSWALSPLQMLVIVTGHVLAVLAAHDLALAGFASRVQALRSEFPLTTAMVFYTFVGLWIVTQGNVPAGAFA